MDSDDESRAVAYYYMIVNGTTVRLSAMTVRLSAITAMTFSVPLTDTSVMKIFSFCDAYDSVKNLRIFQYQIDREVRYFLSPFQVSAVGDLNIFFLPGPLANWARNVSSSIYKLSLTY